MIRSKNGEPYGISSLNDNNVTDSIEWIKVSDRNVDEIGLGSPSLTSPSSSTSTQQDNDVVTKEVEQDSFHGNVRLIF